MHRVEKILVTERLGEKLDGARLHRLNGHRDVAIPGDKNDGEHYPCCCEVALEIEPAPPRQSHIHNKANWAIRLLSPQILTDRVEQSGRQAG
jgi:hypothetical protein